jgi:hypothetical protein
MRHRLLATTLALLSSSALAETAPFDLAGPTLRVSVTHEGATLPIENVPQLATGDRIAINADLPEDQAAHYILVAAFLRGATNPPPDKWFAQAETWTKKGRKGLSLTVPEGAQQVVLFLAPETGGDFPTLRDAVQGRPGAFVRAAQDLAQASLDRRRLETYLGAVRRPAPGDPDRLERITPLLARSLQVKVNTDCLGKLPELQASCLLQNQDALVLNDGHSNAITDALAGPGVGLALNISATPQGGLGQYSPYIAAVRDVIGLFSSLHTAKYQYIPALATPDGDRMNLILNSPPSFHNPKSVLVSALPIVAPMRVPPLEIVDPTPSLCAQGPETLLPIGGAPLIYATRYAHGMSLRVSLADGKSIDLPATPDAERGGLVIRTDGMLPADLSGPIDARVHGMWGFEPFDGPTVRLVMPRSGTWQLPPDTLSTGGAPLLLTGGAAACVINVTAAIENGNARPVTWKATGIRQLSVTLPDNPARRAMTLQVETKGLPASRFTLAGAPAAPRFAAGVIARHVERPQGAAPVGVALANDDQIASDATLTFSLRAEQGMRFTGRETIEIAAASGGGTATLSGSNGLTLADAQVAIATVQPGKALGSSAFGPLRARIIRDGVAGDWFTLGTLVRLPVVRQLRCAPDSAAACELTGDNLFLIAAVSATPGFEQPVAIPPGYPGNSIQVPRPADGTLYVRLHDDPDAVNRISG